MIEDWIIYILVGGLGFFVGLVSAYQGYSTKVKDILDDFKIREIINDEQYEFFTRIYITRKDKTTILMKTFKKIKGRKEKKEDEIDGF